MLKNLIDQSIIGLQIGSIYALIALGYTMVYGIVKLINFAHGDLLMVGAYVTYYGTQKGLSVTVSMVIAIVFCAILGIVIDLLAYKPLRNAPRMSVLITAIGVSFLLESLALILFGAAPKIIKLDLVPKFLKTTESINIMGYRMSYLSVFVISVTLICMIILNLFIKYTKLGKATRAVSQDSGAATLMGINTNLTISITFAIGAALGGLGGVMYALMYPRIEPYMGVLPGLKAFIAAVFGGMGSIPGAMAAGYILGFIETYIKAYISTSWANPIVFLLLIIILLFKPSGLFGKNIKEKV
ncbi:branched-chain amino acid ABC transporter permease [Oceanivirga salmonicida]|uniref:branched-chain amino acid ABC transporter permease n=1 Tax=Oceanivirga salmonicida TaxID=1769291 RepID=UPI00082FF3E7|nr:branched-chain amino acid ABC transporter permease [Oceanivirga salmonicida]